MRNRWMVGLAVAGLTTGLASSVLANWTSRSGDLQNTANVGDQPGLRPDNVHDLAVSKVWQTLDENGQPDGRAVIHTPIVTHGLLIFGDFDGRLLIVDTERNSTDPGTGEPLPANDVLLRIQTAAKTGGTPEGKGTTGQPVVDEYTPTGHLGEELGNYVGIQSTPTAGMVTVPDGQGGEKEELRLYVPAITQSENVGGLYCFNLSKVLADKDSLTRHDGTGYACSGSWPKSLMAPSSTRREINGSPKLSIDQPWDFDGDGTIDGQRDVLYTPTTGLDCADGRMWALDPVTGDLLWDFDPVVNQVGRGSLGGVIWTTPALNRDRSLVYVTTGDCVGRPQVGEMSESIVALNALTGEVVWHHQRRLIDTADLDIGTGPSVVDVDSYPGCHVVVNADKDGCIYGYDQQADIPDIGEAGWDPLRPGQQRVLWKKCFVPGTLNGGFNCSNGAVHGRLFMQQTNAYPGGHNGADDSNAFALDACTGKLKWHSSDIAAGRTDAAIASDMLFQTSAYRVYPGQKVGYRFTKELHVVSADSGISRVPEVLAVVDLPTQPSLGGGGVSIVDSKVYVPIVGGVALVEVVGGSNASPPRKDGLNVFAGPYPIELAPGSVGSQPYVNVDDPYPLMLENPNPSAIVEQIAGFPGLAEREAEKLQKALGE